jgi:lysophospholipid acyltransferase (LPLAT)-like uncharacterized protein
VEQEYSWGQKLLLLVISILGPILLLLYGFTWRVKWSGVENLQDARAVSGSVLFAFWHSRLLGLCYTHRFRGIGIMVSKSFDGEWISRVVGHLGYRVFRGSASRDGAPALLEMLRSTDAGDLALTVDGPRGPAETVKPGIFSLASKSGLPVVPISYRATRAWRLKSWDRFIIPKPFSIVTVVYGRHIMVPADLGNDAIRELTSALESGINSIG